METHSYLAKFSWLQRMWWVQSEQRRGKSDLHRTTLFHWSVTQHCLLVAIPATVDTPLQCLHHLSHCSRSRQRAGSICPVIIPNWSKQSIIMSRLPWCDQCKTTDDKWIWCRLFSVFAEQQKFKNRLLQLSLLLWDTNMNVHTPTRTTPIYTLINFYTLTVIIALQIEGVLGRFGSWCVWYFDHPPKHDCRRRTPQGNNKPQQHFCRTELLFV